jgi:hypothetical protein
MRLVWPPHRTLCSVCGLTDAANTLRLPAHALIDEVHAWVELAAL